MTLRVATAQRIVHAAREGNRGLCTCTSTEPRTVVDEEITCQDCRLERAAAIAKLCGISADDVYRAKWGSR